MHIWLSKSVQAKLVQLDRYYGPEFVSRAILQWLLANGIDTALNDPGKPWQDGTDESVNGKFRDECLNVEWFRTRPEVSIVIEQWRRL